MTPAAVLVLLVAALLVVSALLLAAMHSADRAEVKADRRLKVIGALRAENRELKERLADHAAERRVIGPTYRVPHPPPAVTQIIRRAS